MWKKIKQLSSKISDFLYDNRNSVYTGCFLVILFTVLFMNSEIKHTGNLIESEKEKIILSQELNMISQLAIQQNQLIDLQTETISRQKKYMLDANQGLKQQEDIIKKLIQYLKDIGEWPPEITPIDPDKITRSEAIHEEEVRYLR
tara:strand:- start:21 stop:455 length:435 start_codon:yes stop_codon:yes gene_type:complete